MVYLVAGIDPGKKGGWAIFDRQGRKLIKAGPLLFDDPRELYFTFYHVKAILIERAQAAPGQGVSTAFEYGRGFGRAEAAAMMTGAQILYVAPAWWKGKLAISADKKKAVAQALKIIPGLEEYVYKAKHEGIAEAALIGSILTDRNLTEQVIANNSKREAAKTRKRTRPSFRL